jgi:PAS domain-containing protein
MQGLDIATASGMVATGLFAALSAILIISRLGRIPRQANDPDAAFESENAVFLFRDETLIEASPPAMIFLGPENSPHKAWERLRTKLSFQNADICRHLDGLHESSVPFETRLENATTVKLITGRSEAGFVRITIENRSKAGETIEVDRRTAHMHHSELAVLREVAEHSPVLSWVVGRSGTLTWANKAYFDLAEKAKIKPEDSAIVPKLFAEQSEPSKSGSHRASLSLPGQPCPLWFEETTFPSEIGREIHFAIRADPVVRAEETLRNFVQTLTKTFAHLPIGLAIFDRSRQLALFNPALTDLTALDPQWLTSRPALNAFLDRLRENRHIPEPKNYKNWRDRIAALEQAAIDGSYEENWPLPDGRTYRVIGRPHPEGALAFLFEDITPALTLQRQFRAELELSQSVLDILPDAIAVFSRGQELMVSNAAFAALWGMDPGAMLARLDLADAIEMWSAQCLPSATRDGLRELPGLSDGGTRIVKPLQHCSGQKMALHAHIESSGALICRFTDLSHALAEKPKPELVQA